jgi:hypothetical protein
MFIQKEGAKHEDDSPEQRVARQAAGKKGALILNMIVEKMRIEVRYGQVTILRTHIAGGDKYPRTQMGSAGERAS